MAPGIDQIQLQAVQVIDVASRQTGTVLGADGSDLCIKTTDRPSGPVRIATMFA
jgi:hypothetical protein